MIEVFEQLDLLLEAPGRVAFSLTAIIAFIAITYMRVARPILKYAKRIHDLVECELTDNEGKSMKDTICRIERKIEDIGKRFDEHVKDKHSVNIP